MPVWSWILIGAAAAAAVALVALAAIRRRRTMHLRGRFGPEYERLEGLRGRGEAEAELSERERRRAQLDIRPLSAAAREHYLERWHVVQGRFVDEPAQAVSEADELVAAAMRERGYPVEDFEDRTS